jgi:hypothetical protein
VSLPRLLLLAVVSGCTPDEVADPTTPPDSVAMPTPTPGDTDAPILPTDTGRPPPVTPTRPQLVVPASPYAAEVGYTALTDRAVRVQTRLDRIYDRLDAARASLATDACDGVAAVTDTGFRGGLRDAITSTTGALTVLVCSGTHTVGLGIPDGLDLVLGPFDPADRPVIDGETQRSGVSLGTSDVAVVGLDLLNALGDGVDGTTWGDADVVLSEVTLAGFTGDGVAGYRLADIVLVNSLVDASVGSGGDALYPRAASLFVWGSTLRGRGGRTTMHASSLHTTIPTVFAFNTYAYTGGTYHAWLSLSHTTVFAFNTFTGGRQGFRLTGASGGLWMYEDTFDGVGTPIDAAGFDGSQLHLRDVSFLSSTVGVDLFGTCDTCRLDMVGGRFVDGADLAIDWFGAWQVTGQGVTFQNNRGNWPGCVGRDGTFDFDQDTQGCP